MGDSDLPVLVQGFAAGAYNTEHAFAWSLPLMSTLGQLWHKKNKNQAEEGGSKHRLPLLSHW